MIVTIHVAAVAYIFRSMSRPTTLAGSLFWIPLTISIAVFLSWPISRAIIRAFDPGDIIHDRICPRCGRPEIRPLIRHGAGLFQPVAAYRCAACWSTVRHDGENWRITSTPDQAEPVSASEIAYLSDPLGADEIQFLDDVPGLGQQSVIAREHPARHRVGMIQNAWE